MPKPYHDIEPLKNVYLEDSYVLAIQDSEHSLTMHVEAVLTKDHPQYYAPAPTEAYCYRKIRISINGADSVEWLSRNLKPITDPDGSIDYGNIDNFEVDGNTYYISGEWGELNICGGEITVQGLDQ